MPCNHAHVNKFLLSCLEGIDDGCPVLGAPQGEPVPQQHPLVIHQLAAPLTQLTAQLHIACRGPALQIIDASRTCTARLLSGVKAAAAEQ